MTYIETVMFDLNRDIAILENSILTYLQYKTYDDYNDKWDRILDDIEVRTAAMLVDINAIRKDLESLESGVNNHTLHTTRSFWEREYP